MPKRSNKFQKLVHLVHQQLTDCKVVESPLFVDRRSGEKREVDIAILSEIAGYPVVIGVECRDHKRRQSSSWVEEMWAKHQALPTSSLVLVSSSGYYRPAKKTASALGIELLTLEQASGLDWPNHLPRLRQVRMIEIWRNPVRVTLVPAEPWYPERLEAATAAGYPVFSADGSPLGTVKELLDNAIASVQIQPSDRSSFSEEISCDADCHVKLPPGTYLAENAAAHVRLREMIFRLHFEIRSRVTEPTMYQFKDSVVGAWDSTSTYGEILYSFVASEEGKLTAGASIGDVRFRPPACKWDVAVPIEYHQEGLADLKTLDYRDPSQFDTNGEPTPDPPQVSIRFKVPGEAAPREADG